MSWSRQGVPAGTRLASATLSVVRLQPRSQLLDALHALGLIHAGLLYPTAARSTPAGMLLGVYVAAAAAVDPEFPHELGKRRTQDDHSALGPYRFGA